LYEEESDEVLLAAVAAGDRRSFRTLMTRHAPAMLALAERITGSPEDADEIVQEAFVKLWAAPEKWRPDGPASFSTWFYRVVVNACLDRRRRASPAPLEVAGDPADERPNGLEVTMSTQRRKMVAESIETLPDRQRAALSLYYFSEVSAPQAARILGLSLPAVEALLVRARKALRRTLASRGIERLGDVV
jgi:RNA polymerase sigma-70 factor (ECF subfamily)